MTAMPQLKHLERPSGAVTLAFCPDRTPGPALLALGTVAGAVDVNFSSSSTLEIVSLDWASPAETPAVVGAVQAPDRFCRLAWGQRIPTDPTYPGNGLLAGGLADGSVALWDAAIILSRAEGRKPLLQRMTKHKGAVKGLEFNPSSSTLLASGAADSDLCIWDLTKATAPSLYPGVQATPGVANNEITHVSWNRKVQHILASCHSNGTTVVWDLKKQKPVISFRDPNSQRRASVLQWNPEVATQLVVASDDDRSPTLQMWDLRNSSAPLKEFVGHNKGVMGMAWSPHDPTLLLSCGKDSRNICWDVHSADVVCELPSSHSWNFDIQWAPHNRGVFATSCFDGELGLYNLLNCTISKIEQTVNADFSVSHTVTGDSVPLKRVPTWMKRPVSASFGFGGKLMIVTNHKVSAVDATGVAVQRDQGVITMKKLVTDTDLVTQSELFEEAIAGCQKDALQQYCEQKADQQAPRDPDEAETWAFLSLLFESDARRELLRRLGFEDVMPQPPTPHAAVAADGNGQDILGSDGAGLANGTGGGQGDGFQDDDPDFFDKLPEEGIMAAPAAKSPTIPSTGGRDSDEPGTLTHRTSYIGDNIESSHELEDDIQRAIIAGNYDAAVESCFKAHRLADALLIANIFNSELFQKAMHRYMKLCPKPYMTILRANLDHDWEALVRIRPVGKWKETLALLATYTQQDEWKKMCELLAGRLAGAGMHHAAILCNICSGNLDNAVAYWIKTTGSTVDTDKLQAVIEKSVIMGIVTNSNQGSTALSDLITSYAALLAAQGRMTTAYKYLSYAPGEASSVLKDRIYRSGAALDSRERPPPFPFQQEAIKAQPIQHISTQMAQPAANPYAANAAAYRPTPGNVGGYGDNYSHYNHTNTAPVAQAHGGSWGAQQGSTWQQPAPPPPPVPVAPPVPMHNPYQAAAAPAPPTQAARNAYHQQTQQPNAMTAAYGSQYGSAQPAYGGGYQPASNAYAPQAETVTQAAPTTFRPVSTHAGQDIAARQQVVAHQVAPGYQSGMAAAAPPVQQQPVGPAVGMDHASGGVPYVAKRPTAQPSTPTGHQAGGASNVFGPAPTNAWDASAAARAAGAGAPGGMPESPAHAAPPARPAAPPPPAGPPANVSVATADTSKVPAAHRSIVTSLTNLFNSCMPLANNPVKKREMDDNTKKLGQLLWRLNAGELSEGVIPKLQQLCQAIDAGDWPSANHIQVQMTTTDWEECGLWLSAIKRLIKMRQQMAGQ